MSDISIDPTAIRAAVNGDSQFALGHVPAWFVEVFFLPGDWLIRATISYAPPVARLFELESGQSGSGLSGVVSAIVWLLVARLAVSAYGTARDFDRALTGSLIRTYEKTRRTLRTGVALLGYRLRRQFQRRRPEREVIDIPEPAELSDQELRALCLHFDLLPGYALALSEVASALRLGRHDTRKLVGRLVRLDLLATTLGGGDGENSYTLTRGGRALLVSRKIRSRQTRTTLSSVPY